MENQKQLQLLVRSEKGTELKNANAEVEMSGGLIKVAEHNAQLWLKFLKKFCENARMSKNDLTEVSMKTEQNREGKYTLLFKMGSRGHKILQLLGDNLENGIENYVENKSYELKPLKEKFAPPPEKEEPKEVVANPVAAEPVQGQTPAPAAKEPKKS